MQQQKKTLKRKSKKQEKKEVDWKMFGNYQINQGVYKFSLQEIIRKDATMKIVMDPIAGDYISGKGFGNIRTEYYNKGEIS